MISSSQRQTIRQQAILKTITGMLMELHREDPEQDCDAMARNILDYAAYGFITDDELLYAIMGEAECSRYFQKSYDVDIVPGTAAAFGGDQRQEVQSQGENLNHDATVTMPVQMRANPVYTLYSPSTGILSISDRLYKFKVIFRSLSLCNMGVRIQ